MRTSILLLSVIFLTLSALSSENSDIEPLRLKKKELVGEITLQKKIMTKASQSLQHEKEYFKKAYGMVPPAIEDMKKIYGDIEQELKGSEGIARKRLEMKREVYQKYESKVRSFLEKKKKAEEALIMLQKKLSENHLMLSESEKTKMPKKQESELKFSSIYKNGTSEFSIADHCAVWLEKEKTLRVILTPAKMSSEEKSQIKEVKDPFFISWKELAQNPQHWKNDPHLTLEIVFSSKSVSHKNANFFRIFEQGVSAGVGSSSIQATFGEEYVLEEVDFVSTLKALKFHGQRKDKSWRFHLGK